MNRSSISAPKEFVALCQKSPIGAEVQSYYNAKVNRLSPKSLIQLLKQTNKWHRVYAEVINKPLGDLDVRADVPRLFDELRRETIDEDVILDGRLHKGEPAYRTCAGFLKRFLVYYADKYAWGHATISEVCGKTHVPRPRYTAISAGNVQQIYNTIDNSGRDIAVLVNARLAYHMEAAVMHPGIEPGYRITNDQAAIMARSLFSLAMKARLRAFEICHFKRGHLNVDTGDIVVVGKGRERGGDDTFIWPSGLADIKKYLDAIPASWEYLFPWFVIEKRRGRNTKYVEDYTMLHQIWDKIRSTSGVSFTLHRMGHVGITIVESVYGLTVAQEWARHVDIRTTATYADKGGSELREKIMKDGKL